MCDGDRVNDNELSGGIAGGFEDGWKELSLKAGVDANDKLGDLEAAMSS
jgi:hypothetical protein